MKKKYITLLLLSAFAVTSCSDDTYIVDSVGYKGIIINGGQPLTLLVDLNDLMPTTNTVATEQTPLVFRSIQDIADEFTEMFPNVTISWAYSKKTSGNWSQWMTTQIASGDAPDIVMMHGSEYSDRDWYFGLDEALEEPNIFIENEGEKGFNHWKDQFPKYMWDSDMTSDAAGKKIAIPVTCYPGTATAYFYNKSIFEELNLSIPKTWEELKNICDVITKAGYVAIAPWSLNAKANVDVWDIQYSLGPSYANYIKSQWDYNNDGNMSQDEMIRAVYEGTFYGQGKNRDNLLSMLNEVKNKYNNILETGAGSTDYEPEWNKGRVAMMEDGMWRIQAESLNVEKKFEYGIFPTPLANSTTSEYCTNFTTRKGAYNPPIQDSFNIVRAASEQKGEAHFEAAKLFLMWLTTPQNIDRMIDELHGQSIGAIYGTKIPAEVQEFMESEFAAAPNCNWPTGVTVATQDTSSRYFQYWVADKYEDDKFLQKYDEQLHQGCLDMINALHIDTTGWKNGYIW